MNKNIKVRCSLLLLITALLLLSACGPKETGTTETDEPAQVSQADASVQVVNSTVVSRDILLDPAKTEDSDSLLVSRSLYEGLVTLDANGDVQPGIAASWVISDDELDYIFEIRPNYVFSDGSPVTIEAVEQNFNRWFDPENPLHGDGNYPTWLKLFLAFRGERDANKRPVSQIDGVQIVDRNNFLIHLNRPEPNLLKYLAEPAFSILSPASLASPAYGTRGSSIISSGQYVITAWTDEGMTLSPNPQYWKPVEGGEQKFTWK
jgi:oligopeptide transport system substrate-binding protein